MPAMLDLDALPPQVLADLRREAEANGRTVEAEVTDQITTRVNYRHRSARPELSMDVSDGHYGDELPAEGEGVEFTSRGSGVPVQLIDRSPASCELACAVPDQPEREGDR